jgi:hypothetical protein
MEEGIMRKYIRYDKLSAEIKDAIYTYWEAAKQKKPDTALDDAMEDWFLHQFDAFMIAKYHTKGDNMRKHFRLDVEIPIRVVELLIESSKDEVEALELIGTIVNISKGGLYFISDIPLELSSIIRVVIDFRAVDTELTDIEALAMVVRQDKRDDNKYGIGVMFSSIYDNGKRNLNIFILKNLSYYLYS